MSQSGSCRPSIEAVIVLAKTISILVGIVRLMCPLPKILTMSLITLGSNSIFCQHRQSKKAQLASSLRTENVCVLNLSRIYLSFPCVCDLLLLKIKLQSMRTIYLYFGRWKIWSGLLLFGRIPDKMVLRQRPCPQISITFISSRSRSQINKSRRFLSSILSLSIVVAFYSSIKIKCFTFSLQKALDSSPESSMFLFLMISISTVILKSPSVAFQIILNLLAHCFEFFKKASLHPQIFIKQAVSIIFIASLEDLASQYLKGFSNFVVKNSRKQTCFWKLSSSTRL